MEAKNIDLSLGHDGKNLYALFKGEIDHHTAQHIRGEIDKQLYRFRPPLLVMDMGQVGFMDSSGIAVVINALRCMAKLEGKLMLSDLGTQPMKVFRASGIDKLVDIKEVAL